MADVASQILHPSSRSSDKLEPKGTSRKRRRSWVEVREGMSSVVLAVGPGHTLREAATKMKEKGTGAALVFDDESPAPRIITQRDVLPAVPSATNPAHSHVTAHTKATVLPS